MLKRMLLLLFSLSLLGQASAQELLGVRASFFDFVDDPWKHIGQEERAARFYPDGLLVMEDGIIKAFGDYEETSAKYPGLAIRHLEGRLILPGFIDGHIHVPQTRVLGAYGEQLLPWLQTWVYPEESKYRDRKYAVDGTTRFFDNLLASGTTTCQAFLTTFPVSVDVFFEEAARRNMRVIGGLTGIDKNAPPDYVDTANNFYRDSKRLLHQYHGKGRGLYAITPRFAYGASTELMEACQKLKQEHPNLWVNTHISENPAEVRGVLQAHPGAKDYLAVYEKYGLVGPKFSGGHGVWLSDGEFERLADKGAAVIFCPCSNLFLGSGLFRLGRATDPKHRVRLALGTDMGGGNRFSMIQVLDEAYKVGMCNNTLLDGSVDPTRQDLEEAARNKVSPYRAFYLLTLGGAEALYLDKWLGNFKIGKEADFVVLDWNGGQAAQAWHQSLIVDETGPQTIEDAAQVLFGIMAVGDDRCVAETWIMGKKAYDRDSASSRP